MTCDIVKVIYSRDHILELTFEDGAQGPVDLSPYASKGGVFEKFSDLEYFKKVEIHPELGTLCWPGGVDIAPETLYALAKGTNQFRWDLGPFPYGLGSGIMKG